MRSERLHERPFDDASRSAIVTHIERVTDGYVHWADLVLTRFIAGREAVCDLFRGDERVGVAVSIDACETAGHAAEVSVFCRDPGDRETLEALLDWAEARARTTGRACIDIPAWPGTGLSEGVLAARGYGVGHVMYTMERPSDAGPPRAPRRPLPAGWRWKSADPDDLPDYHRVAGRAFADVPGAFVPDFDRFAARQREADPAALLLQTTDVETPIAAFLRVELTPNRTGRLAALGRHPIYRGLALGDHLVARGLKWLTELGAASHELEVAATNHNGLELYQRFGFAVAHEMVVYRLKSGSKGASTDI